ncbi:MAG: hypothetical protein E6K33_04270 [Gammaproteobacteria bacterium]|nr:MAG: hypothetical protein E6K33_04270 [Gammaproteobacteria bacterium]
MVFAPAYGPPFVSDLDGGRRGRELLQRANRRWKSLLEAYQPPPLDPARDEALREYVTRRKRAMPDEPG